MTEKNLGSPDATVSGSGASESLSGVTAVPDLPQGCGSWICTSPEGSVFEFFARPSAETVASLGWKVETALAYLQRINAGAAS